MLYIGAFTVLLVASIIIYLNLDLPLLIATAVIFAGLSFGFVYTKDSVIVQEETSSIYMKKMMSFYANLQNILGSIVILMIILMISWSWTYKEQHD